MRKLNQALEIVRRDPIWNTNILNFMEDNPVGFVDIEGESVVVVGDDPQPRGFVSSRNAEEVKRLMERFPNMVTRFSALEEWILPLVARGRQLPHYVPADQFILPDSVHFDPPKENVEPLIPQDVETVIRHMTFSADHLRAIIEDRIAHGVTAGIRRGGKLIAWSMTHKDGALGFLGVLPDYRRQGLARELSVYLIGKVREMGRIPMVQVQPKSVESRELGKKMGFVYQKSLVWIDLK